MGGGLGPALKSSTTSPSSSRGERRKQNCEERLEKGRKVRTEGRDSVVLKERNAVTFWAVKWHSCCQKTGDNSNPAAELKK